MCGGSGEKIEEPKLGGKPNTGPKMQPGPWGGDMELEKKNKVLLKDGKSARNEGLQPAGRDEDLGHGPPGSWRGLEEDSKRKGLLALSCLPFRVALGDLWPGPMIHRWKRTGLYGPCRN